MTTVDLNLKLDYVVTEDDHRRDPATKDPRKITGAIVHLAVSGKYPQGVKARGDRSTWARIERSLKQATNRDEDSIQLSLEDVRWLSACVRPDEWSVPTNFNLWADDFTNYVDGLIRDAEASERTAKNGTAKAAEASTKV